MEARAQERTRVPMDSQVLKERSCWQDNRCSSGMLTFLPRAECWWQVELEMNFHDVWLTRWKFWKARTVLNAEMFSIVITC